MGRGLMGWGDLTARRRDCAPGRARVNGTVLAAVGLLSRLSEVGWRGRASSIAVKARPD